jgi:predicted DNA-binding transcriptional regulator AlpA
MKQLSRTDKHTPFENKPVNGLKSDQLRFVRPKKVCRILSISHQQLWRMRQAGAFINPIQVSSKVVAFRSGVLLERDGGHTYHTANGVDEDPESPMNQLLGSSITYRIAVGPQQGRKVFA